MYAFTLAWISGCGGPDEPPKSPAREARSVETPAPKPEGVLHLRVDRGSVLREAPTPPSPAIRVLETSEVLRVLETRGDAYRVAFPGGEGWIRGGEELRLLATRLPPQPAGTINPEILAPARSRLKNGGRETSCGPYRLVTDLDNRPDFFAACTRFGNGLDRAYASRYGVEPVGEPRETLLLFADPRAFRNFTRELGSVGVGYAGHAQGSEGYLAMSVGELLSTELAVPTLVHEMTHLVNRRALGAPLPRWLSEGLADGLGDPATVSGLGPIEGLKGAEAVAYRVLDLPNLPNLKRLTSLDARAFDRDPAARDYEQSAVFVRFLVSDPELAPGFRAYLQGIADGEDAGPEALLGHLGNDLSWSSLDARLEHWIREILF